MSNRKSSRYCSVPHCSSRPSEDVSLHYFPKNEYLKNEWARVLNIEKPITKYMHVCSLHFKKGDYFFPELFVKKRCLKKGSIPSVNLPERSLDETSNTRQKKFSEEEHFKVNTKEMLENLLSVSQEVDAPSIKTEPPEVKIEEEETSYYPDDAGWIEIKEEAKLEPELEGSMSPEEVASELQGALAEDNAAGGTAPDPRVHSCCFCSYITNETELLQEHMIVEHCKPLTCPHCDYMARNSGVLKSHIMAKHTFERPFSCPHCEFRAVRVGALNRHIMAKHSDDPIPLACPHCEYSTVNSGSLQNHTIAEHSDVLADHSDALQSIACPYCEYQTKYSSNMKAHFMTKHSDSPP